MSVNFEQHINSTSADFLKYRHISDLPLIQINLSLIKILLNGMLIYLFKKKAGELKDHIVSNTIHIVAITI